MSQPIEFVRDALSRGVTRDQVSAALQQGGWSAREIQTALNAFVETSLPMPVPRKRVSTSPKEAFFFLVLFSTLYTFAFALGSVLFDLINLNMPQPGETASWWLSSLRCGIASVTVAFPIFLFMCRLIGNETVRNPGQKISPIRRWLTYLTLFVASIAIVTDLIALIVTFLEGDITLRFGLKAAVVAVLAGSAFTYYLSDLRRDEVEPSAAVERHGSTRGILAVMITVVVATVAAGFWFAGSPMRARLLAQDRQRVNDLTAIYRDVQRYYVDKKKLPESLEACDINPATFVQHKKDRITGEPYVYRVVDSTHFVVGATFALPSSPGEVRSRRYAKGLYFPDDEGFWNHKAGAQTFQIDATKKEH